jgi:hypothetical protein
MLQPTTVRTRITRHLAIPTMAMWLVCVAACDQQPNPGQPQPKASGGADTSAGAPVHPDVPGRTEPCPREGGLEKSGYPCEPTRGQKTNEAQKGDEQQADQKRKGDEARKAGEGQKAGDKK